MKLSIPEDSEARDILIVNAEETVVSNQLSEESTGSEQMQAENEKSFRADNLIGSHKMSIVCVPTQDGRSAPAGRVK